MREFKTIRVETPAHIGETTAFIFTHAEFLAGEARWIELLGRRFKPIVRVKMRREVIA